MVKVLSLRLKQCFSPFTMLPVEGSSETGLIYIHIYIYIYIISGCFTQAKASLNMLQD